MKKEFEDIKLIELNDKEIPVKSSISMLVAHARHQKVIYGKPIVVAKIGAIKFAIKILDDIEKEISDTF